jgi:hypothetical protein
MPSYVRYQSGAYVFVKSSWVKSIPYGAKRRR